MGGHAEKFCYWFTQQLLQKNIEYWPVSKKGTVASCTGQIDDALLFSVSAQGHQQLRRDACIPFVFLGSVT